MNKRPLIERLLDKWPAKVICMIISIFLYIFHQTSIIDKRNIAVPLKISENGLVMHVESVPSAVTVAVRGNDSDIKTISSSDFEATVNLDNITEKGVYKIPVKIELSKKLMEFDTLEVKLKDSQIEIAVDLKEKKYAELVPSVTGEVAHGFTISSIELTPSYVEISGAKTVLDKITQINTSKINVSNAKNTFKSEIEYLQVGNNFKIEDKPPYTATVIISALNYEKNFANLPVKIINLSDELEIISTIPKVNISLAGTMPDLESYKPADNFIEIDCASVEEEGVYSLNLNINVPKKFEILNKSYEKINVKFIKKTEEQEENLKNENSDAIVPLNSSDTNEHKDLMMSKVEGAVNNMIQNESALQKKSQEE